MTLQSERKSVAKTVSHVATLASRKVAGPFPVEIDLGQI